MTDESEEWGPWVEHDGSGCPVATGVLVEGEFRNGIVQRWRANCVKCNQAYIDGWYWDWNSPAFNTDGSEPLPYDIIRYRIKKPRALRELREMIQNLPVREDA